MKHKLLKIHAMNASLKLVFFCCSFITLMTMANEEENSTVPHQFEQINYANNWDFSGYIKVLADIPTDDRSSKFELDDVSLFISGNINQWLNPFIEAEYFGGEVWNSKGDSSLSDGKFIFERLYNDFKINNTDHIRLGKFLAPVGYWNLIHAAPLVWTVNRPLTTTYSYSNYISGLGYGHSINPNSGSRFDLYAQIGNDFNAKPLSKHPRRYNKVIGSSWVFSDNLDSRSSLDMQYAEVKKTKSERFTVSFHKLWYLQSWDIETQLIYTHINKKSVNFSIHDDASLVQDGWDGGGYLQARYKLSSKWNIYGRGEYFHIAINNQSGQNAIFGARYRLKKWGNINVEYKTGHGDPHISNDGISISYNAMFR